MPVRHAVAFAVPAEGSEAGDVGEAPVALRRGAGGEVDLVMGAHAVDAEAQAVQLVGGVHHGASTGSHALHHPQRM